MVTAGVTHGRLPGRDFELRIGIDAYAPTPADAPARTLRIDVSDTRGERRPPRPEEITVPAAVTEDGRGLLLVAELADRWMVLDRAPVGQPVRAELDLPQVLDLVVDQVQAWHDIARESVAVCVPTHDMADDVVARLAGRGIPYTKITADGPRHDEGVHVGTMYRFKGLEYRRMIIAGASQGKVPRASVDAWKRTDRARHQRELQRARSLLFVAATRARDALVITWNGEPSRFLLPLGAATERSSPAGPTRIPGNQPYVPRTVLVRFPPSG